MTVNQKMFAEVHKLITEFPELHFQGTWESGPEIRNTCGTTRCIAGWATWLAAKERSLLSRKREKTTLDMTDRLARIFKLDPAENDANEYLGSYRIASYPVIGAHVLGLSSSQAHSLFHDYNQERVVARVKSFAETGEDLSEEEQWQFDSED